MSNVTLLEPSLKAESLCSNNLNALTSNIYRYGYLGNITYLLKHTGLQANRNEFSERVHFQLSHYIGTVMIDGPVTNI